MLQHAVEQIIAISGEVWPPRSAGVGRTTAFGGTADGTPRQGRHIVKPDEDTTSWTADLLAGQLRALGARVQAIRKSQGWSQQDLGNHTGIGRRRAGGIERGQENLTLEALWRLADRLQMHWADLLDDRVTDPPRGQHPSVPFDRQLKAFGTRVHHARVLQRLSQQALTDRTRIGRSAISEIEDGTQNVTLETLSRLATGLAVHWVELLDDRQATPPQPGRSNGDDPAPPRPTTRNAIAKPRLEVAAEELADAFDRHDRPRLGALSSMQLHRHLDARRLLSDYVEMICRDTYHRGLNPAVEAEWASVAALRRLTHHLLAAAQDEQVRRDGAARVEFGSPG